MIPMGKISHFMHMCMNFVLFLMSPIFIFKYFTSHIEEMMNKVLYFNEVFYKNGITFVAFFLGDTSSKIVVERKEWHYSINRFTPATFLCLF
jgi:cell shape-determining protein MreC